MNATTLRIYGAMITSILVAVALLGCLAVSVVMKDQALEQLIVGGVVAQFSIVVGYWVGSSAGSAQKDEQQAKASTNPPPP